MVPKKLLEKCSFQDGVGRLHDVIDFLRADTDFKSVWPQLIVFLARCVDNVLMRLGRSEDGLDVENCLRVTLRGDDIVLGANDLDERLWQYVQRSR